MPHDTERLVELRTFALKLAYDGSAYGGSQFQLNTKTVQEELEKALQPLAGSPTRVAFAGRTDAGVHATGQVAAVVVVPKWTAGDLQRALNARLPDDIAVVGAVAAPEGFDPRRCASGRRYEYRVLNASVRSPMLRRTVWHVPHRLNDAAVRAAAALLVGEHDFAAFAGPVEPGTSTIRRMIRADTLRHGCLLKIEFEANAFLPHQVRRTVGALIEVGRGRLEVWDFESLLRQAMPGTAGPAAPARGLSLVEVMYEGVRFEMDENG